MYLQDLNSDVYALSLADGHLLWHHRYRRPDGGPNGLAVANGVVYGNTDTSAFALSARTGVERWRSRLTRPGNPVTIAPLVANGLVYTSSTGQSPGGRGTLFALDTKTGAVRWRFDTIVGPWRFPREASGGGAWHPPSVDAKGRVYWGTANPYPWGGSRARPNGGMYPGPVRHTDSLLVLDGRTGELLWSDQVTPHDVRDYDFQLPPLLIADVAVGAGKAGRVIAWDRATHARLWETEVGVHRNDRGPLPTTTGDGLSGTAWRRGDADGLGRRQSVRARCQPLLSRERPRKQRPGVLLGPITRRARVSSSPWRRRAVGDSGRDGLGHRTSVAQPLPAGSSTPRPMTARIYGLSTEDGAIVARGRMRAGINACPAVAGSTLLIGAGADHPGFPAPVFELVAYQDSRALA